MKTIGRVFALLICLAVGGVGYGKPHAVCSTTANLIVVEKAKRTLILYASGRPIRTYHVDLGSTPVGPKREIGDGKTPEGRYVIDHRNASSKYHRSLHVSYPSAADSAAARKRGVSPGGDVFIHGLPNRVPNFAKGIMPRDWTLGCIAVSNEEIEEIWRLVPNGTPIDIRP